MSKLLGLPPISPELKSISSYLQRANELKANEPVMAYWCAYHAAQLGISLKAKGTPSRNFLFELLGALEQMKKEIGPSDAVDVESASAAYVENFALKVFAMADNEDRRDQATRSTAKKFLAAANFLEVLKVFPKSEISESNEEKIRYAKWKAADIAKAFREGRKPISGPAGQPGQTSPPESENTPSVGSTSTSNSYAFEPVPNGPRVSPSPPPPPHALKRASPPPHMDKADISRANGHLDPHTPPRRQLYVSVQDEEVDGPEGTWSTVATPGSAGPSGSGVEGFSPDETPIRKGTRRGSSLKTAWVSGELEGVSSSDEDSGGVSMRTNGYGNSGTGAKSLGTPANPSIRKIVHFTPSVTGGSSVSGSPPVSPGLPDSSTSGSSPEGHRRSSSLSSPAPPTIPQNAHPFVSPHREPVDLPYQPQPPPQTGASAHFAPVFAPAANANVDAGWLPPTNQVQPPVPPPPVTGFPSNGPPSITYPGSNLNPPSPPPSPPRAGPSHSSSPPQLPHQQPRYSPPPPPPPPPAPVHVPASPPPELTPAIIAKAQKHCRFAISALDYEDAEQARKELRAALAALGG